MNRSVLLPMPGGVGAGEKLPATGFGMLLADVVPLILGQFFQEGINRQR